MEKDYKSIVAQKLNLKDEIAKSKVKKTIDGVQIIDGKITAEFNIESPKNSKKMELSGIDYNRYKKIFNNFEEFADYSKNFLQGSTSNPKPKTNKKMEGMDEETDEGMGEEMGEAMSEGMGEDSLELPLNTKNKLRG